MGGSCDQFLERDTGINTSGFFAVTTDGEADVDRESRIITAVGQVRDTGKLAFLGVSVCGCG